MTITQTWLNEQAKRTTLELQQMESQVMSLFQFKNIDGATHTEYIMDELDETDSDILLEEHDREDLELRQETYTPYTVTARSRKVNSTVTDEEEAQSTLEDIRAKVSTNLKKGLTRKMDRDCLLTLKARAPTGTGAFTRAAPPTFVDLAENIATWADNEDWDGE